MLKIRDKIEDAASAGSSSAGVGSVVATVDFGATFTDKASATVTGQTWVESGSSIVAQVLCTSDPDEHYLLNFKTVVSDVIAGTGFTVTVYSTPEAKGTYDVMCVGSTS